MIAVGYALIDDAELSTTYLVECQKWNVTLGVKGRVVESGPAQLGNEKEPLPVTKKGDGLEISDLGTKFECSWWILLRALDGRKIRP